jgi:hypothetical protein
MCLVVFVAAGAVRAQEREAQIGSTMNGRGLARLNVDMLPDALKPQYFNPQNPPSRLTLHDRFGLYVHSFTTVESAIGPAFGAAYGQWQNEPHEWGQEASGYGRRIGSGYGRLFISQTIRFGVAAADNEDPRFEPSNESGFWRRAKHAIAGNFVTHSMRGERMPAYSRFAGPYGAAFTSNAWYPRSQGDNVHAFERGSTAFASGVGWSLMREFWPDVHRKLHLRM